MTNKMLRRKLLREIKQVDFVLKELNLFLDTHPDHKEALEKFQKKYGLTVDGIYGPKSEKKMLALFS